VSAGEVDLLLDRLKCLLEKLTCYRIGSRVCWRSGLATGWAEVSAGEVNFEI